MTYSEDSATVDVIITSNHTVTSGQEIQCGCSWHETLHKREQVFKSNLLTSIPALWPDPLQCCTAGHYLAHWPLIHRGKWLWSDPSSWNNNPSQRLIENLHLLTDFKNARDSRFTEYIVAVHSRGYSYFATFRGRPLIIWGGGVVQIFGNKFFTV